VVGDDDQSIYESLKFADPEGIITFPSQYVGTATLTLTICRRCPPEVIQKALKLISNNKKRVRGKTLVPYEQERQGKVATIYRRSKKAEVEWLVGRVRDFVKAGYQYKDMLILFPEGKLAEEYVKALKAADIPCVVQLWIGSVFDTECFAWFLATLRFLAESSDNLSLRQCLDYAGGIGKKTVWQLRKIAEVKGNSLHEAIQSVATSPEVFKEIHQRKAVGKFHEYLQALFGITSYGALGNTIHEYMRGACGEDKGIRMARAYLESLTGKENLISLKEAVGNLEQKIESGEFESGGAEINAVRIMTMHSAKGLESGVVILPALEDDIIPGEAANVEERRRLFYVSVTRTTELLLMSWAAQRVGPEIHRAKGRKILGKKRSRFLVEMGE
jgi:superfamily I DNA/RNA helicase